MKISVFNGSPRGKRGTTHHLVKAFLAGASEAGADVENIFLVEKNIKHCLGCVACWIKTPGKCIQKDDMEGLVETFMSSDVSIFATPIHIDNVSGILKNFIDRLIVTRMPYFEVHTDGETRHLNRYDRQPKIMMISTCGYPEQSQFQVIRLWVKRFSRNFDMEVAGEIYRSWGWLLKAENQELQSTIENYMQLVAKAGREVAATSKLSSATAVQLDQPLLPREMHVRISKKRWDEAIEKGKKVWTLDA